MDDILLRVLCFIMTSFHFGEGSRKSRKLLSISKQVVVIFCENRECFVCFHVGKGRLGHDNLVIPLSLVFPCIVQYKHLALIGKSPCSSPSCC